MAQIFRPAADTWLRAAVTAAILAAATGVAAAAGYVRSDYATGAGWVVHQPVPFSHQHHVGGLGVDCRFCHTTVEVTAEAGYPATETCMTCHSQVWTNAAMLAPVRDSLAKATPLHWNRVASVPDYVYFRHDMHVRAGVGCSTCHGRVDKMPLMRNAETFEMRWCVDCHRDPAPLLRPHDRITDMTWTPGGDQRTAVARMAAAHIDPAKLTDCITCHR
jgi:hypothetical protein